MKCPKFPKPKQTAAHVHTPRAHCYCLCSDWFDGTRPRLKEPAVDDELLESGVWAGDSVHTDVSSHLTQHSSGECSRSVHHHYSSPSHQTCPMAPLPMSLHPRLPLLLLSTTKSSFNYNKCKMFTCGGHRIASYHGKRMHLPPSLHLAGLFTTRWLLGKQ